MKDRGWGIAVIVLSLLELSYGLFVAALGLTFGAAASSAASDRANPAPDDMRGMLSIFGAVGDLILLVGVVLALSAITKVVGGVAMMKSRRVGFVTTGVLSAVSLALNLLTPPIGLAGAAISGFVAYYCYARLSGKDGPPPLQ